MLDSTPASASPDRISAPVRRATARPVRGLPLAAWVRTPAAIIGFILTSVIIVVAVLADLIAPGDPFATVGPALAAPSGAFPFGTDDLGRNLLTGVVHGVRTSVLVAVAVGVVALPLGLLVGAISGASGGRIDDLLMRFTEVWQILPRFFLALMVIALFGPGLDRLVVVLGLTSWALLSRIVRAEILSIREREFVEAAHALGVPQWRIVGRHMLPHALPAALVYVTLVLGQVCLIEASLGFLGLSDPNVVSLGSLAGQAQRFLRVAWWMWFFPGIALITLVVGLNLIGDALDDRIRGRH